MSDTLEAIRARDAALHYCATCGNRASPGEPGDYHNVTVDECDASLRRQGRTEEWEPGHLCGQPSAHHPFVEGEIPEYEAGERDRRTLLRLIGPEPDPKLRRVMAMMERIVGPLP